MWSLNRMIPFTVSLSPVLSQQVIIGLYLSPCANTFKICSVCVRYSLHTAVHLRQRSLSSPPALPHPPHPAPSLSYLTQTLTRDVLCDYPNHASRTPTYSHVKNLFIMCFQVTVYVPPRVKD